MSERKRRHFSGREKVQILKQHLVEKVPVSDLCDQHQLQPTQVYAWLKEFFENGHAAFDNGRKSKADTDAKDRKIAQLQDNLRQEPKGHASFKTRRDFLPPQCGLQKSPIARVFVWCGKSYRLSSCSPMDQGQFGKTPARCTASYFELDTIGIVLWHLEPIPKGVSPSLARA